MVVSTTELAQSFALLRQRRFELEHADLCIHLHALRLRQRELQIVRRCDGLVNGPVFQEIAIHTGCCLAGDHTSLASGLDECLGCSRDCIIAHWNIGIISKHQQ